MSNNASTDEKIAGGLLLTFGVALAWTPLAPVTSAWMIPFAVATLQGKGFTIGAGATFADDGRGVQPFIGPPENALERRERETALLEALGKQFALSKRAFLASGGKFRTSPTLTAYTLITENGELSTVATNERLIKNFLVATASQRCPTAFLSNNNPVVDCVYVIRRNLGPIPIHAGWISHSGMLLRAVDGSFWVCEYGVGDTKKVDLYQVSAAGIGNATEFTHVSIRESRRWRKQRVGTVISPCERLTVDDVKKKMEDVTKKREYSMLLWNCHMAQEATREALGLSVPQRYIELMNEISIQLDWMVKYSDF